MAATGTALYPGAATFPGAAVYPGQGGQPLVWVLYSTADADDGFPAWVDASSSVRSASTARGRATELDTVDAGTARIVLNNRTRGFDPLAVAALAPMNRWWIREQFSGATRDIFKGYAESYTVSYPAGGLDSVTTVACVDEFKVLALNHLDTTDPPRNTYSDVVMYDSPAGYWPMGGVGNMITPPLIGEPLLEIGDAGAAASVIPGLFGAIVGQAEPSITVTFKDFTVCWLATAALTDGQSGDAGGLGEFAIEAWFASRDSAAGVAEYLVSGPLSGGLDTWALKVTGGNLVSLVVTDSTTAVTTVTSTTQIVTPWVSIGTAVWFHIVGTVTGGHLRLYVNGAQEASAAFTGTFGAVDAGGFFSVGNRGAGSGASKPRYFDEIAFYKNGLTADRILAHYLAGATRGLPLGQLPGARIHATLDNIGSRAPRAIRPGSRTMTGAYMTGQPPLGELRNAEHADAVDAVLFIAADGTVTFLDDGYRSVSPWSSVQATFDDGGTGLPYDDVTLDYSDAFLVNEWDVTRVGATTTTARDATSRRRYGPRPQSLTDLQITDPADQTAIASAMLAKYKDPMVRITSLTVNTGRPAVTEAVFALDIGARIRVLRQLMPGGGAAIDQTVFVQSITTDINPTLWTIKLGVSPL